MTDQSPSGASVDASGWERLGRHRRGTGWAALSSLTAVMLFTLPIQLAFNLGGGIRNLLLSSVLAVVVGGLAFVAVTVLLARRFPQPWVHRERRQVRVGRTVLGWSDLDWAKLRVATGTKKRRSVGILVGAGSRSHLIFVLRGMDGAVTDAPTREAIAEVIRGSSIAMPKSSDDPTGRFARYNFPENISKNDALRLIADPPAPDDPLPIPS